MTPTPLSKVWFAPGRPFHEPDWTAVKFAALLIVVTSTIWVLAIWKTIELFLLWL